MNLHLLRDTCPCCEILYINGVRCHETGCPEEWRDSERECKWCGSYFSPSDARQRFCDDDCAECYIG